MTRKQIQNLIEDGIALQYVTSAYSDYASIKLKKIRRRVEQNRSFYNELDIVYGIVERVAYQKKITPPPKLKKTLSLVLTSNYRFYGNINNNVLDYFLINSAKYPTDRLIIGKTAAEFLKGIRYFHSYDTKVLKDDLPNNAELDELRKIMDQYQQIIVYHPQFKTVLIQRPVVKEIKKHRDISKPLDEDFKIPDKYIFEPEILKMLEFFESQITLLLLEQTFLEAELSRTAARLIAMDEAQDNAKDYVKDQKRNLAMVDRFMSNSQLLRMYSSLLVHKQHLD